MRYLDAGSPAGRVTVSSDGGGCLPLLDAEGRVVGIDVGAPSATGDALAALLRLRAAARAGAARVHQQSGAPAQAGAEGPARGGSGRGPGGARADGAVADVMARGRWHVRAGRPVVRGAFEGAGGGERERER